MGERLAAVLDGGIRTTMSEDRTRESIVRELAEAGGVEPDTVRQIVRGEIACPPAERLAAFAGVLDGVEEEQLRAAAEQDGCTVEQLSAKWDDRETKVQGMLGHLRATKRALEGETA